MKNKTVRLIVGLAILGFMALSAAYSLNFRGLRSEFPPPAATPVVSTPSP
jgi:hypothetical protein